MKEYYEKLRFELFIEKHLHILEHIHVFLNCSTVLYAHRIRKKDAETDIYVDCIDFIKIRIYRPRNKNCVQRAAYSKITHFVI